MSPALAFALATVAFVLAVDAGFAWLPAIFPGGTISAAVRRLAARRPLLWRAGYIVIAACLFRHFFGSAP